MPYRQVGLICDPGVLPGLLKYLRGLGFDIKAIWCPEQDLALQTAAEHEIPFTASQPDEILLRKEVEMVIMTGKPSIHAQICVKALGIGKHILCDSPVGLNSVDAQNMLQSAEYYPQILSMIGFGLRHMETFHRMKCAIADGSIGTPLMVEARVLCPPLVNSSYSWLWEADMGGGVLNLVGSHIIDLIAFLLDQKGERVQGLVKTHSPPPIKGFRKLTADDFSSFLLKINRGSISATVTLNSLCAAQFEQQISVCGSAGRLVANNLHLYRYKHNSPEELLFEHDFNIDQSLVIENPDSFVPLLYQSGFARTLKKLSSTLREDSQEMERSGHSWRHAIPALASVASFEDAQYVRAVIDAVRHSSSKGDWVRVSTDR